MDDPSFKYQFRIILIGDSSTGKSALLRYFMDGSFAEVSDPTVGVDFFAQLLKTSDGTSIKLQLWDTAGQEQFRSITKSYYRNSVGALLVYDISNRDSFRHIPLWMNEVKRQVKPYEAVFTLVGCKHDLASKRNEREVSVEEANEFAKSNGLSFFETSSKNGFNVQKCFQNIMQTIYDKIQSGEYKLDNGWDGIRKGYLVSPNGVRQRNATLHLSNDGESVRERCC